MNRFNRREFLIGAGAVAAASAVPLRLHAAPGLLYPPLDLSYFQKRIAKGPSAIRFGYAAITWNGDDRKAMREIAAAGYPGIQIRSNVIAEYNNDPAALRADLEKHKLTFVALSSGGVRADTADEKDEIARHVANAKFLHDAGGLYLQVTDTKPKDRAATLDDYKRLARLMTEIAKQSADLGVQLGYHNHMNSMGERPEEVDRLLALADPRWVKLELDIAHYAQGGGDPAEAIGRYHDRLLFLHIKDVHDVTPREGSSKNYEFVELGRGRVDLPGVFAALKKARFRGWAIVELDGQLAPIHTPAESAVASKDYLEKKLGYKVS
ncbi:MAG TPA: sugar phosphate isomerase/epimerase [Terriglobales bacterium]|nr:sugar phosphate isomerase/epimerase [Terriglobales bacterium]